MHAHPSNIPRFVMSPNTFWYTVCIKSKNCTIVNRENQMISFRYNLMYNTSMKLLYFSLLWDWMQHNITLFRLNIHASTLGYSFVPTCYNSLKGPVWHLEVYQSKSRNKHFPYSCCLVYCNATTNFFCGSKLYSVQRITQQMLQ